jgi:antitoxin component YwqK of YwqJK toxin-antitoxin module
MFRVFLLMLFAIFSSVLFGQDTLNITDGKGQRQGYWRKLDSAGRVIYEGRFKDGTPAGKFSYFYPDGKLKTISIVSDKGKRAATVSYFTNGRKMAEGKYLDEKKDSTWQFFSESNGSVVSRETYRAGLIEGQSKVFYPEGGLSESLYYKSGVKDGLWEQYYLDGKLKLRGAYKAGEKHGPFKTYYNSGKPMIEGQYNLGHQDGIWNYYDEKGAVSKKEFYESGNLIKTETAGK